VVSTAPPLSSYLSPHELLVVIPVEFAADLPAAQLTKRIKQLRASIEATYPDVKHIFIQPAHLAKPAN
jgi:hypothetical protein